MARGEEDAVRHCIAPSSFLTPGMGPYLRNHELRIYHLCGEVSIDRTHPPSTMMSSLFLGGRCWLSWAICCCVAPSPWTNQESVSRPADQSQPSITCTPSA